MDKINRLICLLIAIAESAKAVHYSVKGDAAYSKHLLADKIYDGLYGFIDNLKEMFFLAGNEPLLSAKEYLNIAADFTIKLTDDDKENFISLQKLIIQTLELIEGIASALTRGEQSLLDDIAKDLQGKLGLINLEVKI